MARVTFTRDYNHRWPSRAITAFKAGWTGTVKAEVADAAQEKGAATRCTKPATRGGDERLPDSGRSGNLARQDHADHVGAGVRDQLLDGAGQ